ncbi:MAG: hypothetical protein JWL86_7044 [Rhizobium sp.]|nr:hypothetical protein [Rhizobium sp.]
MTVATRRDRSRPRPGSSKNMRSRQRCPRLLGHSTITMTNRYAHLGPGALRAAVATLDEPAPSWNCSDVAADPKTATK